MNYGEVTLDRQRSKNELHYVQHAIRFSTLLICHRENESLYYAYWNGIVIAGKE